MNLLVEPILSQCKLDSFSSDHKFEIYLIFQKGIPIDNHPFI